MACGFCTHNHENDIIEVVHHRCLILSLICEDLVLVYNIINIRTKSLYYYCDSTNNYRVDNNIIIVYS